MTRQCRNSEAKKSVGGSVLCFFPPPLWPEDSSSSSSSAASSSACANMAAAPALPALGRRVAIAKWAVEGRLQSLTGDVVEHRKLLGGRNKAVEEFRVKYDLDGAECWHAADEVWEAADEAEDCDRGWALVNDWCTLTLQPLTQPAKTSKCKHVARCNLDPLAASGRMECPDCSAKFSGRRDLVVDVPLRDALGRARSAGNQVWQSPQGSYTLHDRGEQGQQVTIDLLGGAEASRGAKQGASVAAPPRPVPAVPLQQRDAPSPQASPAAAATAVPAPVLFKHKLDMLKRELAIAPATAAYLAVAEANQQVGITPSHGQTLGSQLDRLLATISS